LAVTNQRQGLFEEAEALHRLTLQWYLQLIDAWRLQLTEAHDEHFSKELEHLGFHIYIYNLCLALGRQGRIKEMQKIRADHKARMDKAESTYGMTEKRLQGGAEQNKTYSV
jgi:hypothetical protein